MKVLLAKATLWTLDKACALTGHAGHCFVFNLKVVAWCFDVIEG